MPSTTATCTARRDTRGEVPGLDRNVYSTLDNFLERKNKMAGLTFALGYFEGFAPLAILAIAFIGVTRL